MSKISRSAVGILVAWAALSVGAADLTTPYSLMAEASKAIEEGKILPGTKMFDAALAASWAREEVKNRDFLTYFLKHDNSASVQVRRALVRMCMDGGSPAYFERYLKSFPHDADALSLGLTQFARFVSDGKTKETAEQARILLDTWPTGRAFDEIMVSFYWACHDANVIGLKDGKILFDVLAQNKKWKFNRRAHNFITRYIQRGLDTQLVYDLYIARPELEWSYWPLERIAEWKSTPPATAFKLIKRLGDTWGYRDDTKNHYLNRFYGHFDKELKDEWKAYVEEVKAGKHPQKKGPDYEAPTRELAGWISKMRELREKKINGKEVESFQALAEILNKYPASELMQGEIVRDAAWYAMYFAKLNKDAAKAHIPFDKLAALIFEPIHHGFDVGACNYLMQTYEYAEKLDEGFARLRQAADKAEKNGSLGLASRRLLVAFYLERDRNNDRSYMTGSWYDWDKKTFHRGKNRSYDRLAWAIEAANRFGSVPVPELVWFTHYTGVNTDIEWRINYGAREAKREKTEEETLWLKDMTDFYSGRIGVSYIANGARSYSKWRWNGDYSIEAPTERAAFKMTNEDADNPELAFRVASLALLNSGNWEYTYNFATNLMAKGKVELAYLLTNSRRDLSSQPSLQRVRTEAAGKMPGLYPVNEKHPAYPLYVAAEALARNNPERAWTLLSANLKEFDKDPMRFQPQFVLWALEQYRKVRGTKDALRDKAWEHVEKLLQNEASYPPEVAAGFFLLRAEIAEDRMQYEIAHTGYQTLRNHAQYRKTPAGRQAMFRDVELMITMGSTDGASQLAEQWATAPESDIRAQGHFVLAKIAFMRKDYDETRKELDKVFDIDFTHAEARLLQGEWKLATNYEVDDPQVLLGQLSDRSAIRPGAPLSISVQDKNLSVAGGGASIPVLVTTKLSGDVEKVLLYPGTRDPSLFRGSIDTRLGLAKKGNSTVELAGDDIVTYRVDPDFLNSRGLSSESVKTLSVVDDAELTIGTGDEMKALKPGLPLSIQVKDGDRSRSSGDPEVTVSVATTSGDRIPNVKLKETGPSTGIFEAIVETSIPPPRPFASDWTASQGPEDLVSSKRNKVWQSLADGKKPKYVGVDTMNSTPMRKAVLEMDAPETVARIRLWGTLAGEEVLLGSYPAEDTSSRHGIRRITARSDSRNRTDFIRELQHKPVAAVTNNFWGVRHEGNDWRRHLVRGMIYVDEPVSLRLKFNAFAPAPEDPSKDDRMNWHQGAVEVRVDGALSVVYSCNNGDRPLKKVYPLSLDRGVHDIEIYTSMYREKDSFEILREMDDGELKPLPDDWTDEKAHPELAARLVDKCKITRSDKGFEAAFVKPELLRKVRWEFLDFTGRQVSAKKLHLEHESGALIVPSVHDFTEALGNNRLEIAPGDQIVVNYEDEITCSGRARIVEKKISSLFFDGSVEFMNESIEITPSGEMVSKLAKAYRIAPGDSVLVRVKDNDLDLTDDVDTMKVTISTASGAKLTIEASEQTRKEKSGEEVVFEPGVFIGRFRTALPPKDGSPLAADVLALKPGESVTASYMDEDNTKPGVPIARKAVLAPVPTTKGVLRLSHIWGERVEDKSPEAKSRLISIRRRPSSSNATHIWRQRYYGKLAEEGETAIITPDTELPIVYHAPDLARHELSSVKVRAATEAELAAAEEEGREPDWIERRLRLMRPRYEVNLKLPVEVVDRNNPKKLPDTFYGRLSFLTSATEERLATAVSQDEDGAEAIQPLVAKPGDIIVVRCITEEGETLSEAKATIRTTGWIGLAESTYEACNPAVHLGESFHVMVVDPDRDTTEEQDEIEIQAKCSSGTNNVKTVVLRETKPRSGVFTGSIMPVFGETSDENAFKAVYGDEFTFTYQDDQVDVCGTNGVRTVTGSVLPGSDGAVRAYSKRFRTADQAVLVQFRLAECLFEMAKDFRKLKDATKSANAIADGRGILEAALRDYPNTTHAAEGEFLLANLYEQLAEEERQSRAQREKDGEDLTNEPNAAEPLYREAVARFAAILSTWPEGDFAARCQYHKALCLERLGDYARASEEYVKMTYLFPESPLVGDASVRLASYYYQKEQRYDIAGKIYTSFRNRFPNHPQAPNALFMGGQCLVKRAESLEQNDDKKLVGKDAMIKDAYRDAVDRFMMLVDSYKDVANKDLLAQALYWAGDASFRLHDYANAYIYLKRVTFEYPESKWARYARGMLLQESESFKEVAQ